MMTVTGNYLGAFALHRTVFEYGILLRLFSSDRAKHVRWLAFHKIRENMFDLLRKPKHLRTTQEKAQLKLYLQQSLEFEPKALRRDLANQSVQLSQDLGNMYSTLSAYAHPDPRTFHLSFVEKNGICYTSREKVFRKTEFIDSMAVCAYNLTNLAKGAAIAFSTEILVDSDSKRYAVELNDYCQFCLKQVHQWQMDAEV